MTVVGTRPELIKLSCVIRELDLHVRHVLVHTGQNFDAELSGIFYDDMGIRRPDHQLSVARDTAAETIAEVIRSVDLLLAEERPDAFLIYGDTNSCLSALAAKRRRIPVFHMEAGNRSFDERVPEEINRRILDHISDINMPLTEHARHYLLAEGIRPETVIKTGSTMPEVLAAQAERVERSDVLSRLGLAPSGYLVLSAHREENVDDPERLKALIESIEAVIAEFDLPTVFSVHPRTRKRLEASGVAHSKKLMAMPPLSFSDYIALQQSAFCVISDSGTITEEANIVGFPAVTIREAHERPEGMDEGVVVMAGLGPMALARAVRLVTGQWESWGSKRRRVADYDERPVSQMVARTIASYTDYVKRTVWKERG